MVARVRFKMNIKMIDWSVRPDDDGEEHTYSGEVAIENAKHDNTRYCLHANHPEEDDGAAKRGDDKHRRDAEVSNEDRRAELTDEARRVHDHELFLPSALHAGLDKATKRYRVE